jgi:hypothetical protein
VEVLREAAAYAARFNVAIVFECTNRFEINTINTRAEAHESLTAWGVLIGFLIDTAHRFWRIPMFTKIFGIRTDALAFSSPTVGLLLRAGRTTLTASCKFAGKSATTTGFPTAW